MALFKKFKNQIKQSTGILAILLVLICNTPCLLAQSSNLQIAQELMVTKNYVQAELLYNKILKENPQDNEALLGRAILYSWQQKYKAASTDFELLLNRRANDVQTLTAYGYNLAWAGIYVKAESMFRKVLVIEPLNMDAVKGLAYLALWKGKGKLAVNRFNRLLKDSTAPADLYIGVGHAHLLAGRQKEARHSFDIANSMQPSHSGSKELLQAVQASPGFLEISVYGGYTQFESSNIWGLRSAEVAVQPNSFYRVWARYDNTLSLENFALVQNRENSEAYFAGGLVNWNKYLTTKLEGGYRNSPEGSDEQLILLEQQVFLKNKLILKGGGFVSLADQQNVWTSFGGISVPIMDGWSLEPLFYYTRPSKGNTKEQRLVLNSYTQLGKGYQISIAGIYGAISGAEGLDENIYGGSVAWMIPFAKKHWINVLLRYETGLQELLSASLGFKYRIER